MNIQNPTVNLAEQAAKQVAEQQKRRYAAFCEIFWRAVLAKLPESLVKKAELKEDNIAFGRDYHLVGSIEGYFTSTYWARDYSRPDYYRVVLGNYGRDYRRIFKVGKTIEEIIGNDELVVKTANWLIEIWRKAEASEARYESERQRTIRIQKAFDASKDTFDALGVCNFNLKEDAEGVYGAQVRFSGTIEQWKALAVSIENIKNTSTINTKG